MKNIIIIGASGQGSVVLDCIKSEGKYNPVGFVDSYKKKGTYLTDYPILGNEFDIPKLISEYGIIGGIVAIGDNWTRRLIIERILKIYPNFNFITTIHSSAIVSENAFIGRGVAIMPGAIVNSGSEIGDFCFLNTKSSLDHDSTMGPYSSLAPNVNTGGNLVLGGFSVVCIGSNVIENIEIGEHTVVGAGSLVLDHLPDRVVAYGSPAKIRRIREIGEPYLGRAAKPNNVDFEFLK